MRIPPPVFVVVGLAAIGFLASRDGVSSAPEPILRWLGSLVIVSGLALDLCAIIGFSRASTTVNPLRPELASSLVTSGLYAFTRNPMYLGMALILIGASIAAQVFAGFAVVALFVAIITQYQIKPEEAAMRQLFGDEFDAYCHKVRRWL